MRVAHTLSRAFRLEGRRECGRVRGREGARAGGMVGGQEEGGQEGTWEGSPTKWLGASRLNVLSLSPPSRPPARMRDRRYAADRVYSWRIFVAWLWAVCAPGVGCWEDP